MQEILPDQSFLFHLSSIPSQYAYQKPCGKTAPDSIGLTEDDFTSLTPEQIEKFKEKYQSPEVFTLFNGELHVMKMPPQEQKEQKESRKKDAQQKNPAKGKKKNRSGEAR